jgi:glycosyltransferase involved in cell wall biosynthesis
MIFIGMPVFNGETFISKAIDSIIKQSYSDWHLLIADNCSTDGTEKIAREYVSKDPRITYVRHQSNRGAIKNFFFLINIAESKYFMWAASDDEWSENFLELCVETLDSCQDIQFVGGHVVNIDACGTVLRNYNGFSCFDDKRKLRRVINYLFSPEINGKANMIYSVYRLEFCRNLCTIQNVLCGWGSDMAFVFAGLNRGRYKYIPSITLRKRVSTQSDIASTKIAADNISKLQFGGWFPISHFSEYCDAYYRTATNSWIRLLIWFIMTYRLVHLWCRLKLQRVILLVAD